MAKGSNLRLWVFIGLILIAGLAIYSSSFSGAVVGKAVLPKGPFVQYSLADSLTFVTGDSFTVAGDGPYAGIPLTATFVSLVAVGPSANLLARFDLFDPQGNRIDTQTIPPQSFVDFENGAGIDVVNDDLFLRKAYIDTTTNQGVITLSYGPKPKYWTIGQTLRLNGKGTYNGQLVHATLVSIVAVGPSGNLMAKFNLTSNAGVLIDTQTMSVGELIFEDAVGDVTQKSILLSKIQI